MATAKQVELTVLGCRDLPKNQRLGKQSPYVIVRNGDQEFRSKTADSGDRDPSFNETFFFIISGDRTVVDIQVFNEKRPNEALGSCRVDVGLALHKGEFIKAFPVMADNKPQGSMEIRAKCPVVVKELKAAAEMEAMMLSGDRHKYTDALVAARTKYYGEVPLKMAPHEVVTSTLFDEHLEQSKAIQREEEKEMGNILDSPRTKASELIDDAVTEWGNLAKALQEDITESMEEHAKEATDKFARQISTLTTLSVEADKRRIDEVLAAKSMLLGGIDELLSKYRSRMITACDRYDNTIKAGVLRYKGEVEGALRADAEAKSLAEAASIAPPPPAPPVSTPPRSPARSPQASPTNRSPRAAPTYQTAPSFAYMAPPAPAPRAPAPPTVVYVTAPAAPAPAGYPMTQTERAQAETQQAQSDAAQARAQADRAAAQAQAAQQQAAATQAMMRQQMEAQQRARAVRRGVVGGVVLSRALRR